MTPACTHLDQIKVTETDKYVCEDCVETGDTWVHLRMCLTCGHVERTSHPLVRSAEPGETWMWCYVDEIAPGELVV